MPQTILGIDIGSYSVKIAEIRRSFKSFELIKFFERQIQYNDVLTPEESTSACLRGLIEDNLIAWDHAISALPGQFISSRFITLPFGNAKKIDQTIEFELENYIPFGLEDVVVDYHVVRSSKESSKVLVLYAQKLHMAKFLAVMEAAGVDPRHVCVEGVEFVNLVNLGMVAPEGLYALIDIGHKKTNVTICRGKKLAYTRTIAVGGEHITAAIAEKLNVPRQEAEKLKIEMGQVGIDDTTGLDAMTKGIIEAITGVIDDLILHVRQTFFSYQDEEGEPVSGIYLSGGTSRLPGLDRYLSLKLKQNVASLDCLEFHFSRLEASEVHHQLIPQALALALKGVAPAGLPDINFRRGEFAFNGDVQQFGGGVRRAAIATGLVIILAATYFFVRYYSLSQRLGEINKEVRTLVMQAIPDINPKKVAGPAAALQAVKGRKTELSERMAKLSGVLNVSALDILKAVSENMPPREDMVVDIEDFNMTGGKIKISGKTTSFEAVDKMKAALEKSGKFKNISPGNVRKGVKEEIKFDLTMEPS